MDYTLLKQLVALAEEFQGQQTHPPGSASELQEFSGWLQMRTNAALATPRRETVEREPRTGAEDDVSAIPKLVTFLHRYLRTYCRLALLDTPLVSYDDFTYLATTFGRGPLSKTELITRNIHEKPTGTEIIKRLLKAGLIQEQPHVTDRRSKVLTATEHGRQVLFQLFNHMGVVAAMGAGNLSVAEREQLVYLLSKLDAFHHPIFTAPRPENLELLRQKYFPDLQPWTYPAGASSSAAFPATAPDEQ